MREQDVALGILRLLECRQEAQQQAEFEDPRGGTTLAIVQELLHSHDIDGRVLLTALDMDCGEWRAFAKHLTSPLRCRFPGHKASGRGPALRGACPAPASDGRPRLNCAGGS